ncbi:MAG TPA: NCS2 family permease [Candidatus Paenalcaligenes intestinipullorum]|uniref:NCS2 family permease n=1 Tax=Candidatus Paenalcaligenes intestinipullorum TaxID=2838718 RepID=A0A9D2RIU1_9BURK|nr:NCS2 family permease [Candidatus Paenalcaligenes intestinipullorum]
MFERLFKLREHNTSVRTEIVAGITTFLTMSYIIIVNPNILTTAGMDHDAVFVATCLAAFVGTLVMAFVANWPIGMAPGMGLNAFFTYNIVIGANFTWEQALGAVFISGLLFIILTVSGIRSWIVQGIPISLRSAIVAGIGLFLGFIALSSAKIVVESPATLVTLGDVKSPEAMFAILGFLIIVMLETLRVRGAILLGILAVTVLSIFTGHTAAPESIVSLPPSLAPTFLKLDIAGALHYGLAYIILALILVEIFDATGTLLGVAKRANLIEEGKPNRLNRALFADSTAIMAGSLLGTSSTTAYAESVAGAQAGGRTGLTALTIAILFLLALFFAPIAKIVPAYATAPALVFVACLMLREVGEINWEDVTESVPAALTVVSIPLTYSIATGLAFGFISYAIIKLVTGRWRDLHPATVIVAALFITKFAFD